LVLEYRHTEKQCVVGKREKKLNIQATVFFCAYVCLFELFFCCSEFRYEKLKKGQSAESEESIPVSSNGDPKYVIIDEFEFLDDELES
jgi:hypothetical protein